METTKKFCPLDWIPKPEKQTIPRPVSQPINATGIAHDIEVIVSRIESYRLDLTANYADWLTISFSLADAMGEAGRNYFHRVSRFHPDYSVQECDKQFDKCLKRGRAGVSIKTFFYLAQGAGIDIRVSKEN